MRTPRPGRPIWLDGEEVTSERASVSLSDEGFLAGLGVFETIALRHGRPLSLQAHLARLSRGARVLGLTLPPRDRLERVAIRASEPIRGEAGWLKIVITRGGRWAVFGGSMDPAEQGGRISAILLPWRRGLRDPLMGVKSLNYAANLLGLEEARRRGADEGIWLNTRGHLSEGCTSNLFVMRRDRLFTPSEREGILPGITRMHVLRAAREMGWGVHEGKVRLKRLREASEAFMTSSLSGLRPLVRFEGRDVGDGEPGRRTRALSDRVATLRQEG